MCICIYASSFFYERTFETCAVPYSIIKWIYVDRKIHKRYNADHGGGKKKKYFFQPNQTNISKRTAWIRQQQYIIIWKMRLILSFCGGAYPKFREWFKGGAWEEDYSNLNNAIVYTNTIVEFCMFILVSLPLGLVTRGLSGSPWGTFWYLQVGREFWFVLCTWCSTEKVKKRKTYGNAFLNNELPYVVQIGISVYQ